MIGREGGGRSEVYHREHAVGRGDGISPGEDLKE